jgi:hypothetical protein
MLIRSVRSSPTPLLPYLPMLLLLDTTPPTSLSLTAQITLELYSLLTCELDYIERQFRLNFLSHRTLYAAACEYVFHLKAYQRVTRRVLWTSKGMQCAMYTCNWLTRLRWASWYQHMKWELRMHHARLMLVGSRVLLKRWSLIIQLARLLSPPVA